MDSEESIDEGDSDYDFDDGSDEDEDMDIDMDDDDFDIEDGSDSVDTEFLKESDLDGLMAVAIQQVNEISGLDEEVSRAVLIAFRWKIEEAISSISVDVDTTLTKAGVILTQDGNCNPLLKLPEAECSVCMLEEAVFALPCGHAACSDCWQGYMDNEIESGNHSFSCLVPGCPLLCLNNSVAAKCSTEQFKAYKQNQSEFFLNCSRNLKWCPSPDCNTVIKSDGGGDVICKSCEEPFCFKCGFDHAPASCLDMKAFSTKNSSASKDAVWLIKNAKECPSCFASVIKDGGCNWVKCLKCKYEFCWLCFKQIKHSEIDAAGGSHRCNQFNGNTVLEKGPNDAEGDCEKRKQHRDEIQRVAHYYQRYQAHIDSAKLEEKNIDKHRSEPPSSEETKIVLLETRANAIRRLRTARQTLSASYVFGFYQKWDLNTSANNIFEDLQHLLESRTESLSRSVESSFRDPEETVPVSDEINILTRSSLLKDMAAVETNQKNLIDVCREDLTTIHHTH